MPVSAQNTYLPGSNADLHGVVMRTNDGDLTGPLHWVPERRTWTDPQMSDEWRPDGSSMLYPGGGDLASVAEPAPEPLTVATVMGAVNLLDAVRADERARIAVEGAGVADAHWHSPVTSARHLDAVALAEQVQ